MQTFNEFQNSLAEGKDINLTTHNLSNDSKFYDSKFYEKEKFNNKINKKEFIHDNSQKFSKEAYLDDLLKDSGPDEIFP